MEMVKTVTLAKNDEFLLTVDYWLILKNYGNEEFIKLDSIGNIDLIMIEN